MRFVIVGAGAVGVVLGVSLEHAKHEVTYLVRPGRRAGMGRLLLVHASKGDTRCRERPQVAELGEQLPPFEWAILCTRGDQIEAAMEVVNTHLPPTVTVAVAAAGDGKLDQLRALHPGGPVLSMAPLFAAWSEEDSVWRWFMPPMMKSMVSGEGELGADAKAAELATVLSAAGIPTRAVPSVRKATALPFATGMAFLAGWELAGWDLGVLARDAALRNLTGKAMAEAARIAADESDSLGARLFARAPGPALALLLAAMPHLVPHNAHVMWRTHGPKIRLQTRLLLDGMLASADPKEVANLLHLRGRLPSVTEPAGEPTR